jgi:hypothetical protein
MPLLLIRFHAPSLDPQWPTGDLYKFIRKGERIAATIWSRADQPAKLDAASPVGSFRNLGLLFADGARHNAIGFSADVRANRSVKVVVVIL